MPMPPLAYPPALLREAQRMYEETRVSTEHIANMLGIGRTTFSRLPPQLGWRQRQPGRTRKRADAAQAAGHIVPSRAPAPVPDVTADTPTPIADAPALIARVQQTIARELAAIDAVLARMNPSDPRRTGEAERAARTLASLSRTLRELKRLGDDEPDDDQPRDLDELRRDLSRRLDRLLGGGADGAARKPEPR